MRRLARRALSFLFPLLLLTGAPWARALDIAVLLSDEGGAYGEFATALQSSLEGSSWRVRWSGSTNSGSPPKVDLIITVGGDATRSGLTRPDRTPLLATLLPRSAYEKLLSDAAPRGKGGTSAIYLDQPIARFLNLATIVMPEAKRIGLLATSETTGQATTLRHLTQSQGLKMESEEVDSGAEPVAALNRLLPRSDLLLALPDNRIYKRENTRAILLTTFRHQKPVIAFSASYVNAGSLAAVYSTPAQLGRQAGEVIKALKGEPVQLPPPLFPSHYSIMVNRSVAQSLGLSPADETTLLRALIAADKENR